MKTVVIGGTGLIGSKLVERLRSDGHTAVPASPDTGVDTITGEGLAEALAGAQVVVDVSNAPVWEDAAVLAFFRTATQNVLAAEREAGIGHHIALSVVGAERQPASGYFRAKVAQEQLIKAGSVPYTILRATQFFEFVGRLADSATEGSTVRLAPVRMRPVAADDVAATLAALVETAPVDSTVELCGPEQVTLDELAARLLRAESDPRKVVVDPSAGYFGSPLDDADALIPGADARRGRIGFDDWLSRSGLEVGHV
jgi:uncharacterized protein YbjT (DUF2867 family)